jgi:sporulation protein YlmC with PRC-barrel domain
MVKLASTAIALALLTTAASAQQQQRPAQGAQQAGPTAQTMSTVPQGAITVTEWYKQNVYDPSDNKIGDIRDVLLDKDGKAAALIIGVGGFLGAGEKDVAVPFNAVQMQRKDNNKNYLVMNTTKDALKAAKGFKYDRNNMAWIPEEQSSTTGSQQNAPAQRPANTNR